MALGDPASALPAAFAWHQRDPNSPRATAMIVRASAAMGKRQERFLARLASTLDELVSQPDPALAELREVSLAMLAAGRDSSLRTALEPRLEDDAAWRRLWLQLALEAVDDAASRSDATPWIDPLLDHVEPSDPDEVAALCNALRRLGERIEDGAFAATRRDLARKALERAPRHAGLLRQLALAHEQLGETERAADAYQRVLESDPDDVVSMNNLAVLLSELGRDLDQALSLVDRAISRYPELSALHDTRGQVLAAMGRADDAIQAYETAISLQPESLKWRVNLARHLAATQKWQRTREVLNEIESIAGQRENGVPRTLRDEYLAIREAARNAE
jgi:tetratricopeptide (TPR) repeat protein